MWQSWGIYRSFSPGKRVRPSEQDFGIQVFAPDRPATPAPQASPTAAHPVRPSPQHLVLLSPPRCSAPVIPVWLDATDPAKQGSATHEGPPSAPDASQRAQQSSAQQQDTAHTNNLGTAPSSAAGSPAAAVPASPSNAHASEAASLSDDRQQSGVERLGINNLQRAHASAQTADSTFRCSAGVQADFSDPLLYAGASMQHDDAMHLRQVSNEAMPQGVLQPLRALAHLPSPAQMAVAMDPPTQHHSMHSGHEHTDGTLQAGSKEQAALEALLHGSASPSAASTGTGNDGADPSSARHQQLPQSAAQHASDRRAASLSHNQQHREHDCWSSREDSGRTMLRASADRSNEGDGAGGVLHTSLVQAVAPCIS